MNLRILSTFLLAILFCAAGCKETANDNSAEMLASGATFEQEKTAILAVINEETQAAFSRNYESWREKWVHEPYVTKTYMDFSNNSMTETLGWEEIDKFVRNYFEEHPEPDPLPTSVADINVRLFGNGAWVSYEQNDAERGRKRETRLMEKIAGKWRIAGMHTTIYGFAAAE